MTDNFVFKLDMCAVNDDGSIEITDLPFLGREYPFNFRYKLYLPFEENENEILNTLYKVPPEKFVYTPRFERYLNNRKSLYDEVCKKYLPLIEAIQNVDFPKSTKDFFIENIDLELSRIYPYYK